ncbi:MAG: hypothetical protein AMXMBFR82_06210 [Candidatus Hydrogenedentota bacterium]
MFGTLNEPLYNGAIEVLAAKKGIAFEGIDRVFSVARANHGSLEASTAHSHYKDTLGPSFGIRIRIRYCRYGIDDELHPFESCRDTRVAKDSQIGGGIACGNGKCARLDSRFQLSFGGLLRETCDTCQ